MRTSPINPLKRENTGNRIHQRPTLISPYTRVVTFRLGPSTALLYEFTTVAAIITRPCVIAAVTFLTNYTSAPRTRLDILISRDTLTDTEAQGRDRRISGQRGQHVGFVGSNLGPRYPIGEYVDFAPMVIKGYLWTDGVPNHYAFVTLELQVD